MNKADYFKRAIHAIASEALNGDEGHSFVSPLGDAEIHLGLCKDTKNIIVRVRSKRVHVTFQFNDGEIERYLDGFFEVVIDDENPRLNHLFVEDENKALSQIGLENAALLMLASGFTDACPMPKGMVL